MWARMLVQVLEENGISCTAILVYGAGLTMQTGIQERLRIYVPREDQSKAEELVEELFSEVEE